MGTVTLCVIALNEEQMLGECLASARDAVNEIIVVDTGSVDATVEIAMAAGAKVVSHPWTGDFSAARNAALSHVTSDWVLVLDADERLGSGAADVIAAAVSKDSFDCGTLKLHNASRLDATLTQVVNGQARHQEPLRIPRLLRMTPDLSWEGVVHENVTSWLSKGRVVGHIEADIVHYGYVPEMVKSREKDLRNLRLLERRCVEEPTNPVCRAYLARELLRSGETERALFEAERAWNDLLTVEAQESQKGSNVRPASVTVATVFVFLLMSAERYEQALDVVQTAEELNADHPNLHLLTGTILQNLGVVSENPQDLLRAAESSFRCCLEQAGETFVEELMPGATSWAAWRGLGEVLLESGRPEEAARYFRQVIQSGIDDVRSSLGLAQTLVMRGDPSEGLKTVAPLMQQARADGWTLAAWACVMVGQFEDASDLHRRAHMASRKGFILPSRRDILERVGAALDAKDTFISLGGMVGIQDPDGSAARLKEGETAYQNAEYVRAHVSFMEAVAHDIANATAWMDLGVVYHSAGSQREALHCLKSAVRLDASSADTHHNLALIAWDVGRTDEAALSNRRALQLDPMHAGGLHLHCRMGCAGWRATRAVAIGPSILGHSRAQAAVSNYLRLIGFNVRWGQPDIVQLLAPEDLARAVTDFMDRSDPGLLVVSSKTPDVEVWCAEAVARGVPVVCDGGDTLDCHEFVVCLSEEPTRAMRDLQAFLDQREIVASKPLQTQWEPLLSVVIPTRNRADNLMKLLDRLGTQDLHPGVFEVIVVDDASETPVSNQLHGQVYPFEIKFLRNESRVGPGGSRNQGIDVARAPMTVLFDDDALPAHDNLRGHLLLQNATSEPHLLTGVFELVDLNGGPSIAREAMQSVAFSLRDMRPHGPSEEHGFYACNVSAPTALLQRIRFDAQRFPDPVMDDIDFGYRIQDAGVQVRKCEELRCDRDHDITVDSFLKYCENLGFYHHQLNVAHPERKPVSLVYPDQVDHVNFFPSLRAVSEFEGAKSERAIAELRRYEGVCGGFSARERAEMVGKLELLVRQVSVAPYCQGMVKAHSAQTAPQRPPETQEVWLNAHQPLMGELTSVIIPNLNGFPHIIEVMDSLRRTTQGPVEVIVVDNGSVDGSLEWLRTQNDIILLEMGENVGAPAARNRALEISNGETILFCDNDVVFTPGWRSLMMGHLEAWPDVGVVGPMSDYVVGVQKVTEVPTREESLNEFSRKFTEKYRNQHQYSLRLILFCMLVRRTVVDTIGGFDEAFGKWGFEDDDFTLRAKLAGFHLRVARDCFIRHVGSQTAHTAKINYQTLLLKNWGVFKNKWDIGAVAYGESVSLVGVLEGRSFEREKHFVDVHTGTIKADNMRPLLRPQGIGRTVEDPDAGGVGKQEKDQIISKFSMMVAGK